LSLKVFNVSGNFLTAQDFELNNEKKFDASTPSYKGSAAWFLFISKQCGVRV
jgi:hypothetical protein